MANPMTVEVLKAENMTFQGSGGISSENRSIGFRPAFLDTQTRGVFVSRFADGRPAPCHILDGLPDEVVVSRTPSGRVAAVKTSIVSGFLLRGRFYTREEAAKKLSEFD